METIVSRAVTRFDGFCEQLVTRSKNRRKTKLWRSQKKKNAESVMIDQLARTDKTVTGNSKLPAIPGYGLLDGVKLRGSTSTWAGTKKKKKTEQSHGKQPRSPRLNGDSCHREVKCTCQASHLQYVNSGAQERLCTLALRVPQNVIPRVDTKLSVGSSPRNKSIRINGLTSKQELYARA